MTNAIPPEGDEYNARRQEDLHAAILNKAQLSRRYAEMVRDGAPLDQIGTVIDAIAQIDREIPHISKDLAVSVQGRNLKIFLDRMDASLAKMDVTAALAGVAARLDQQIDLVHQILAAHKETVRGLKKVQAQMRESQEDRRIIHGELASVKADVATLQQQFTAYVAGSKRAEVEDLRRELDALKQVRGNVEPA